jgi:hypothetical protein
MKQPACECLRKRLNRFNRIDGITTTAEVYFVEQNSEKGLQECSAFLLSNFCPECGAEYIETEVR